MLYFTYVIDKSIHLNNFYVTALDQSKAKQLEEGNTTAIEKGLYSKLLNTMYIRLEFYRDTVT